ncbi:RagB/SusD family nutrient uptake outer membrane protein [Sphingobacterium sp. SG20118]|uniref:RagB/SusD family nutrient uptake outer membrane protein n=1 Tax=Sphingobacterium sp. SG20118 TaxID=3367156 RepID=UPI0037DFC826
MKNFKIIYLIILVGLVSVSCTKFLDIKPDEKMVVPNSLDDCDALLDDRNTMNSRYPVAGEVASDNYYLMDANYTAITNIVERDTYIWAPNTNFSTNQWSSSYKVALVANQVLALLVKTNRSVDAERYDRLKGEALFFRAYAWSQLAPVFTLPYSPISASKTLGLALRENPTIDYPSVRSDLETTYKQIITDLNAAVLLLPENSIYKTRPTKLAIWATLSRIGLIISDFQLAESSAKKVINYGVELLDYNGVNKNLSNPFGRFNKEVLFHASTLTSTCLSPSISKVDSTLYRSYLPNDLRRSIYFKNNNNGTYEFKGRYDGDINASCFAGIALDEIYFNYAEALAQNNKLNQALAVFNKLMLSRWVKDTYLPFTSNNQADILAKIRDERRKSLIMRNLRWSDIRRWNSGDQKIKLKRILSGSVYELNAGDLRFAFLIPTTVMEYAPEIIQNKR